MAAVRRGQVVRRRVESVRVDGVLLRPGQWWSAPENLRHIAYYLCLRVHYEMPANAALAKMRETFRKYPEFMRDPFDNGVFMVKGEHQ